MSWPSVSQPDTSVDKPAAKPCPLCGAEGRPLLAKPRPEARYEAIYVPGWIYACSGCGVHFSEPRPTPEEAARFYQNDYNFLHLPPDRFPKELRLPAPARQAFALAKRLYLRAHLALDRALSRRRRWRPLGVLDHYFPARTRSVLDVGCAEYQFLSAASLMGWQVQGVEPHKGTAERVRALGGSVIQGLFDETDIPGRYDAVTFWHVLGHVLWPKQCLKRARALVKDGGRIFIETPNAGYADYFSTNSPSCTLWVFPEEAMRTLLKEAGFELEELWFEEGSYYVRRLECQPIPKNSAHVIFVGRAEGAPR